MKSDWPACLRRNSFARKGQSREQKAETVETGSELFIELLNRQISTLEPYVSAVLDVETMEQAVNSRPRKFYGVLIILTAYMQTSELRRSGEVD